MDNNQSNKPFYKNIWFIVLVSIVGLSLFASVFAQSSNKHEPEISNSTSSYSTVSTTLQTTTTITTQIQTSKVETTPITTAKPTTTTKVKQTAAETVRQNIGSTVYITPTGKRYHYRSTCGGKNSKSTSLDSAINSGYTPCKKCAR